MVVIWRKRCWRKGSRQSGGNKVLTYNYLINLLKKQTYILEDSTMSKDDFNVLKENIIFRRSQWPSGSDYFYFTM